MNMKHKNRCKRPYCRGKVYRDGKCRKHHDMDERTMGNFLHDFLGEDDSPNAPQNKAVKEKECAKRWINMEMKAVPKIKSIEIINKGIIKKAKINFSNGLNIIKGKNTTGKTTVLKEIYQRNNMFGDHGGLSGGEKVILSMTGLLYDFDSCFLLDDTLNCLSDESLAEVLKMISKSKNQIIITMPNHRKIPKIKANIIDTRSFVLKRGDEY